MLQSASDIALDVSVTLGPTGASITGVSASGTIPPESGPEPVSPPFPMGNATGITTFGGPSPAGSIPPLNATGLVPFEGEGCGRLDLLLSWQWAITTCTAIVFLARVLP